MTCEPDESGGGSMEDLGTPPDLLAERFGHPELDRRGGPTSSPWPSDSKGPTAWWAEEQRRRTLAEEVE